MRYKPEHKEKTHHRIVETAAKEFRTQGYEGIGIAKLMGTLQLTHGGFYAHFEDKEELISESSVFALDQSLEMMLSALKSGGISALLDYYLSQEHRDHPELGCPLPILAAELARHPVSSREDFTEKLSDVFAAIAAQMPGRSEAQKVEKVVVLFSGMVGAMSLARAVSDPVVSKSILRSTQEHLLRFIEETTH